MPLSLAPLISSLLWLIALVVNAGPFNSSSVMLIGVGMLSLATVSVVGMVLSGSRWARYTAIASVVANFAVATLRPVDPLWVIALTASAIAMAVLFLPVVTSQIRKLPAAEGPPARSVVVPLLLLSVPFALGLANTESGWPELVVGLTALLSSFAYARVLPGGLLGVRILWPTIAVIVGLFMPWVSGSLSIGFGLLIGVISWHPDVKVAFHPPRESGTAYAIPPELAPQEILDAARIDERGKPK